MLGLACWNTEHSFDGVGHSMSSWRGDAAALLAIFEV